jgi:hypothetical protein
MRCHVLRRNNLTQQDTEVVQRYEMVRDKRDIV